MEGEKNTVIAINMPNSDHMTFSLKFTQDKPHGVWVDWGDKNAQPETYENEGLIEVSHTYSNPGQHGITIKVVDETTVEFIGIDKEPGYRNMVTQLVIGEGISVIKSKAFTSCENLEELTFLVDSVDIGDYAFDSCGSIDEVELPNDIGIIKPGVFFNCNGLKSVKLPDNVSTISEYAFYGCSQLKNIDLEKVYEIGDYAFQGCRKLKTAYFDGQIKKIGVSAFDGCSSLNMLNLSTADTIGENAFCNCKSLSSVIIPATVKTIGEGAFMNCEFLNTIKMEAKDPPTLQGVNAFSGIEKLTIEVPRGGKREYAYATNWSAYLNNLKEV